MEQFVTQAEYARHRGCSRQAVGKLVDSGKIALHPQPDGKKLIDKAEADLALGANVTRILAELDEPPAPIEPKAPAGLTKARTEREQFAARLAELELEERLKKLRPVEDIRLGAQRCAEIMIRAIGRLTARADELHAVAVKDGAHGVRIFVRGLVRELRTTASAEFAKLAAGELVDDGDDEGAEQ